MPSGGIREGAGRKALEGNRVSISFRVSPKTKESIDVLRTRGVNIGRLIDQMIEEIVSQ